MTERDERRPARNAAATTTPTVKIPEKAARMTGVQAAQLGIVAQFEALREQMGPREYVVLVDLVGRWFDEERRRIRFSLRRWVA